MGQDRRAAMPPRVIVRRASREDLQAISDILRKASGGRVAPNTSALFESLLEWAYFVSTTSKVMGVVRWQASNFVACLKDLYVYPPVQRRRLGQPLMERVEQEARALSCEVALLLADKRASWRAMKFYRELGYERANMEQLTRAWREAVEEHRDEGETLLLKKLRERRILTPLQG
jgi:N-acetylglutamate synthase-like GNAT family acetyltransferase